MSAGYLGKRTNWADDNRSASQNAERLSQWGEINGRIVSFDPIKQTATIQPTYKPKFNGVATDMPQLLEVPVRFPRTKKGAVTYPVGAGDMVSLRPMMRSSEDYHESGDGAPSDARSFSLADMEAHLDGGESLSDPIQNFDSENTHIRADEAGQYGIKMSPSGEIEIKGSQGDLMSIIGELLDLLGADALEINYGSSAGTGHALFNRAQYLELAAKVNAMRIT